MMILTQSIFSKILTILMILNALKIVTAVEKFLESSKISKMIPISAAMTINISNKFQANQKY